MEIESPVFHSLLCWKSVACVWEKKLCVNNFAQWKKKTQPKQTKKTNENSTQVICVIFPSIQFIICPETIRIEKRETFSAIQICAINHFGNKQTIIISFKTAAGMLPYIYMLAYFYSRRSSYSIVLVLVFFHFMHFYAVLRKYGKFLWYIEYERPLCLSLCSHNLLCGCMSKWKLIFGVT